jgi:hypothetical protein
VLSSQRQFGIILVATLSICFLSAISLLKSIWNYLIKKHMSKQIQIKILYVIIKIRNAEKSNGKLYCTYYKESFAAIKSKVDLNSLI